MSAPLASWRIDTVLISPRVHVARHCLRIPLKLWLLENKKAKWEGKRAYAKHCLLVKKIRSYSDVVHKAEVQVHSPSKRTQKVNEQALPLSVESWTRSRISNLAHTPPKLTKRADSLRTAFKRSFSIWSPTTQACTRSAVNEWFLRASMNDFLQSLFWYVRWFFSMIRGELKWSVTSSKNVCMAGYVRYYYQSWTTIVCYKLDDDCMVLGTGSPSPSRRILTPAASTTGRRTRGAAI